MFVILKRVVILFFCCVRAPATLVVNLVRAGINHTRICNYLQVSYYLKLNYLGIVFGNFAR